MNMMERPVRIGQIDYTNVWPVFYYFPLAEFQGTVELVHQVPTSLNKAMAEGDVAMGPISAFSYGEHFKDYVLYPDLSVSALRDVKSLLFFHRKPLDELDGAHIALPTTSATTVNLLKIILQKFYGLKPRYTYAAPSLSAMMESMDAALLIGDDAIRASWTDHGYMVTDLGAEWEKHTGLWMTFAVWAIRKDTLQAKPELVSRIHEAFVQSKVKSLAEPEGMVHEAKERIGGTEDYWRSYFANLCYDFGPQQWEGLSAYYQYAWELGLLDNKVPLQIWSKDSVVQVK
ncbi:menaquinone biosynthesis protein [Paenibacillus thalictri]|uniref:Chorismate dehydratase n=1 Tax=Paenibacillus thalictri TaxID=2527873 RepID=A0A4V2J4G7_9BACL|nr:menaquinone biosynthesis protein [Paenibacillus thalictri]TBL79742.1 ABC transporter substrate-binding protein [Paenibacillus thalictri]